MISRVCASSPRRKIPRRSSCSSSITSRMRARAPPRVANDTLASRAEAEAGLRAAAERAIPKRSAGWAVADARRAGAAGPGRGAQMARARDREGIPDARATAEPAGGTPMLLAVIDGCRSTARPGDDRGAAAARSRRACHKANALRRAPASPRMRRRPAASSKRAWRPETNMRSPCSARCW